MIWTPTGSSSSRSWRWDVTSSCRCSARCRARSTQRRFRRSVARVCVLPRSSISGYRRHHCIRLLQILIDYQLAVMRLALQYLVAATNADADLSRKFHQLVDGILPQAQADRLADLCRDLPSLADASVLIKATSPGV